MCLDTRPAREIGVNERTLRRAVTEGAIRAKLGTEPSVECAVLFGSAARGDDEPGSDLDLLA